MTYLKNDRIPKVVKGWLLVGLAMIFMQVVIGGVTRLTGSGLSITRWEIVTGTLPPVGETAWNEAFNLYKNTPQYLKINAGMTLDEFQFIYFWEWFHRNWARFILMVFTVPFLWFWLRGQFSKRLFRRSIVVCLLGGLAGVFGWIMVASGLVHRPWVNAYKLSLHLSIALLSFSYLLWTTFQAFFPATQPVQNQRLARFSVWLTVICCLQIMLGGVMSGMKAGLFFPTWPTMNGEWLPAALADGANWQTAHLIEYDRHPFAPALVQFLHRGMAYLLSVLAIVFYVKSLKISELRRPVGLMLAALGGQVLLGIFTLLNCTGKVPVGLGVSHQGWAVVFLASCFWVNWQFLGNKTSEK